MEKRKWAGEYMINRRPGRTNNLRAIIPGIFLLMAFSCVFLQDAGPGRGGMKNFATASTEVTEKKVEVTPIEKIFSFAYN
jgi:hypothetical protein